jgi:hypothetical protein
MEATASKSAFRWVVMMVRSFFGDKVTCLPLIEGVTEDQQSEIEGRVHLAPDLVFIADSEEKRQEFQAKERS